MEPFAFNCNLNRNLSNHNLQDLNKGDFSSNSFSASRMRKSASFNECFRTVGIVSLNESIGNSKFYQQHSVLNAFNSNNQSNSLQQKNDDVYLNTVQEFRNLVMSLTKETATLRKDNLKLKQKNATDIRKIDENISRIQQELTNLHSANSSLESNLKLVTDENKRLKEKLASVDARTQNFVSKKPNTQEMKLNIPVFPNDDNRQLNQLSISPSTSSENDAQKNGSRRKDTTTTFSLVPPNYSRGLTKEHIKPGTILNKISAWQKDRDVIDTFLQTGIPSVEPYFITSVLDHNHPFHWTIESYSKLVNANRHLGYYCVFSKPVHDRTAGVMFRLVAKPWITSIFLYVEILHKYGYAHSDSNGTYILKVISCNEHGKDLEQEFSGQEIFQPKHAFSYPRSQSVGVHSVGVWIPGHKRSVYVKDDRITIQVVKSLCPRLATLDGSTQENTTVL